jgi:NitT/TauT family transport system substrate-binding protein
VKRYFDSDVPRDRRVACALLCILALSGLSACGRDSANSSNKITIAQPSHGLHILPLDVAVAKGFFKKEGVDAQVRMVNGDATAIPALVSGSVQVAQDTSTPLLIADTKGSDLQVLASMSGPPQQIVMRKSIADSLGISAKTPIAQRVAALKGKKIAINDIGGGLQYILDSVLKKYGVDPNSVSVVAIQPYTAALSALKNGRIDAIGPVAPYGSSAVGGGYGVSIADVFGGEVPEVSSVQYSLIDAKASWIKSHERVANGVRRAIKDALDYIRENPAEAAKIAKKNLPTLSLSELESSIKAGAYPDDIDISESEYRETTALAANSNKAAEKVPYATAVWPGTER